MNTLAALASVAISAMPIAAQAQALGVRVGSLSVGGTAGPTSPAVGLSVGGAGLTGLGSTLGGVGATVGGSSLASVTVPSVTTTGPAAAGTGTIGATVLGGSVLGASIAPASASLGGGLATLGTPSIRATVLDSGSVATVTTGSPILATVGGVVPGPTIPVINVNTGGNSGVNVGVGGAGGGLSRVALGADSFFSSGSSGATGVNFRINGGGGGGGGGGASASADGGGSESNAQVCERVLRRPGAFQRNVVQQCRRVVAQLTRRR